MELYLRNRTPCLLKLKDSIFSRFTETSVELLFEEGQSLDGPERLIYPKLADNFYQVGKFDSEGKVSINIHTDLQVAAVRLKVQKSAENWVLLSEINLRT